MSGSSAGAGEMQLRRQLQSFVSAHKRTSNATKPRMHRRRAIAPARRAKAAWTTDWQRSRGRCRLSPCPWLWTAIEPSRRALATGWSPDDRELDESRARRPRGWARWVDAGSHGLPRYKTGARVVCGSNSRGAPVRLVSCHTAAARLRTASLSLCEAAGRATAAKACAWSTDRVRARTSGLGAISANEAAARADCSRARVSTAHAAVSHRQLIWRTCADVVWLECHGPGRDAMPWQGDRGSRLWQQRPRAASDGAARRAHDYDSRQGHACVGRAGMHLQPALMCRRCCAAKCKLTTVSSRRVHLHERSHHPPAVRCPDEQRS